MESYSCSTSSRSTCRFRGVTSYIRTLTLSPKLYSFFVLEWPQQQREALTSVLLCRHVALLSRYAAGRVTPARRRLKLTMECLLIRHALRQGRTRAYSLGNGRRPPLRWTATTTRAPSPCTEMHWIEKQENKIELLEGKYTTVVTHAVCLRQRGNNIIRSHHWIVH